MLLYCRHYYSKISTRNMFEKNGYSEWTMKQYLDNETYIVVVHGKKEPSCPRQGCLCS